MATDEELSQKVRRCADRIAESGAAALGGLYDLTAQRLVRLATAITRNQHDAEDAVQSALVRVADDPRRLSQADEPWPYLLRMVRNESLLILRRRRRAPVSSDICDLFTRCPVDQLEQEDTFRVIWSALRRLPTEQNEVVVLKIWEGLTFEQVSQILDISPATAASRYRYAIAKLEALLQPRKSEVLP